MTKSALHRTRLRFSDQKNFSVLFFYKRVRQPAPLLGSGESPKLKRVKGISGFYSFEDLKRIGGNL
ncbi:hypothetical protein [Pectobacterium aroidearum]|uniref:hypothetical protein n=1 Tax=Pectobacterium aroidearum TaxID=1201031 RepID=UPI003018A266